MEGRLSEHPVAELICEITEKTYSGALRIERERVKAAIYFEQGEVVQATSNLRVHRLAEYLKQHGVINSSGDQSISDLALVEALLGSGSLTRQRLDEILAEQVTAVMRVVLLWTDGSWSFDGRAHLAKTLQVEVPTQQLLLEASRHIDLKFSESRLTNGAEALSPAAEVTTNLALLPSEAFLLSRIDHSISVDDLIALSGLREAEARQAIYGLFLAGLLKREFWQAAFRTPPPQTVASAARGKTSETKPAPGPKTPVQQIVTPPAPEPKLDPRRELDIFLARLANATNHYEVLDVSFDADVIEIKRAYHKIAKSFHPDRFHDLAGTTTHTQLQSSFARITQAYETLVNPESRAAHNGNLQVMRRVRENQDMMSRPSGQRDQNSRDSESGDSLAQLAEKRFQEGAAALQLGHTNAAASCFSAAARMAPNEAKYRAYFGRVLASNPKTRREAESELTAAVKLDPKNAQYHVMLAALYKDLGFGKRAAAAVERALALDPQNSQARQLQASLEK